MDARNSFFNKINEYNTQNLNNVILQNATEARRVNEINRAQMMAEATQRQNYLQSAIAGFGNAASNMAKDYMYYKYNFKPAAKNLQYAQEYNRTVGLGG